MKEYTDSGCLELAESAFKKCLAKTKSKEEIKNRINFVENGPIFKLWCYIAGKDEERLRNLVLVRNHMFSREKR